MQDRNSGGLDARTLLAFGLMIVVWVAFTQIFGAKKKPVPEDASSGMATEGQLSPSGTQPAYRADTLSAVGDVDSQSTPAPQKSWGGTPPADPAASDPSASGWRLANRLPAEEQEVLVESEFFRAVFSTQGGMLRSWTLRDYTDEDGNPADLVPEESGALALELTGPEGDVDLSRTTFALERSGAGTLVAKGADASSAKAQRIGSGETAVLRFVAEGPIVWGTGAETEGSPAAHIERVYRIGPSGYDIEVDLRVDGIANPRQDHHIVLGWQDGIPNLETQRSLEKQAKAAVALLGEELIKDGFGGGGFGCQCGGGKASQAGERFYEGILHWAGVRGKYFTGMLIPSEETPAVFVAVSEPSDARVGMRLIRPLAESGSTEQSYRLYVGPIDYRVLRQLDSRVDRQVTRLVDFGGKLIAPISKATHWFLLTVHRVVPNYGLVILVLAIVLRVVFHPLTVKSLQSQRKLQLLKPELDAINAKYKDNPELRTKKTMELHKRNGVNPLGGCLPLLLQMPVIYALYNVLMNAMELRKAPFVFWIKDLSSPDTVGHLAGIPINVMPLLMAATMFWQQKLTPTDPRQAPMLIMMPLLMVFFFYGLPSGLVFYWTVTNLLAVIQQLRMKPQMAPAAIPPDQESQTTLKRSAKRARA
ncbi:MAG: YidC/Oxa1 family insertase periplasmic-domain containing protein [Candidatus Eisenbacteria bacterium]